MYYFSYINLEAFNGPMLTDGVIYLGIKVNVVCKIETSSENLMLTTGPG